MTEPQFLEDWFAEPSQKALSELAERTRSLPGAVVEVGSWEGRSTIALANAVYPVVVAAIDTWQGSKGEISHKLAAERDVYGTFMANIHAGTRGNVCPYKQNWRVWFQDHKALLLKFVFIDAEHAYQEVFDNIAAALSNLVEGGIICGDDVHHEPVHRAVLDHFGDAARVTKTLWWWQKPSLGVAA